MSLNQAGYATASDGREMQREERGLEGLDRRLRQAAADLAVQNARLRREADRILAEGELVGMAEAKSAMGGPPLKAPAPGSLPSLADAVAAIEAEVAKTIGQAGRFERI